MFMKKGNRRCALQGKNNHAIKFPCMYSFTNLFRKQIEFLTSVVYVVFCTVVSEFFHGLYLSSIGGQTLNCQTKTKND